jgi:hypothetical protein
VSTFVCVCVCVCVRERERERERPLLEACACPVRMTAFRLSFPRAVPDGILFMHFISMHCGFMHPFRDSKVIIRTSVTCYVSIL